MGFYYLFKIVYMFRIVVSQCLICLTIFLSPFVTNAQQSTPNVSDYHKRVISRLEFLVGTNLIYGRGSEYIKEDRVGKFGFRGSVGFVHTFNSRWELDAKISYENKGYKNEVYSENPGPPPTDKLVEDLTLNYFTLTFLPRYTVIPNGRFEVGIGPYIGYLSTIRLRQKLYFQDAPVSEYSTRIDPGETYKELDFGASFMMGYNIRFKERVGFCVQFIYSLGLIDITDPTVAAVRNNTFSLLIGISLKK